MFPVHSVLVSQLALSTAHPKASKFSFLLFFLFRKHKTDYIPAQHYRNCQDTVKNMYIAVAIAIHEGVVHYIFFHNSTKRLEQLFGILRSMIGGDLNFDCVGLQQRLGTASQIAQIYARHPEWNPPARKLTDSFDRKNVHSWTGDTKVAGVDVAACWKHGMGAALNCLRDSGIFTDAELSVNTIAANERGVDMLRPYRATVGVRAGDVALVDLTDTNDDIEVQQTNGLNRIYYTFQTN